VSDTEIEKNCQERRILEQERCTVDRGKIIYSEITSLAVVINMVYRLAMEFEENRLLFLAYVNEISYSIKHC
jgi:hypothetical protein